MAKIKFENAGGIKDGSYEVKITKIKRVKVGQKKTPATQVKFVGKGIEMTKNFFDSYFGGQEFEELVHAVGFTDFDVTKDSIDTSDLEGEHIRIEVGPQDGDKKFKDIKAFLPLGEDDDEEDDEEDEEDEDDDDDDTEEEDEDEDSEDEDDDDESDDDEEDDEDEEEEKPAPKRKAKKSPVKKGKKK